MTKGQRRLYEHLRLSSAFSKAEIQSWDSMVNYHLPPAVDQMQSHLDYMLTRLDDKRQREADALQRKDEWAQKQKEK